MLLPFPVVGLQEGHPIWRGIRFAIAGNRVVDIGGRNALTNDGNVAVVATERGAALRFDGSSKRVQLTETTSTDVTKFIVFRAASITTLDGLIGDDEFISSATNPTASLRLQNSGGFKVVATRDFQAAVGTTVVATGKWYTAGHSYANSTNTLSVYCNGIRENTASSTGTGVRTSNQVGLDFTTGGGRYFDGDILFAAEWTRLLSQAEMRLLHLQWADLLESIPDPFVIPAAVGGFQSAWAARSTITISGGMTR